MTRFEFYCCVFFFGVIVSLGLMVWQTKLNRWYGSSISKRIRKKGLTCKLCSTGQTVPMLIGGLNTLHWRKSGMNLRRTAGHDPWSSCGHTSSTRNSWTWDQSTIRVAPVPLMDQGSVGRVRDCTGSGPLVKQQAASAKLQASSLTGTV